MISRREFLKIAGVSAILGAGGVSLLKKLEASQFLPGPEAIKAKRWAMVVDMGKFETEDDIKKVIDACHREHNVPDIDNPRHKIKWIWTDKYKYVFPGQEHKYIREDVKERSFFVLCNHCDKPMCVRVCPTKATFKRKDGIVMMDMHRCIGCRFCMAACPYGARSFNWIEPRPFIKELNREFPPRMRGVVEKCTFCYHRLAKGLMPACVEASGGGLIFGDLEDPESDVRKALRLNFTIRRKPELGTEPMVYYIV